MREVALCLNEEMNNYKEDVKMNLSAESQKIKILYNEENDRKDTAQVPVLIYDRPIFRAKKYEMF